MANKRLVTVFGGTGQQGGAVARTLLEDGTFDVRAVTRDSSSEKAQALASQGASLVQADLNNENTLRDAVSGSYAVYAVTNFWDPTTTNEEAQAVRLAEISKEAGVQVFIWASLPNTERLSKGKYPCTHFSGKARAWDKIKTLGFPTASTVEAPVYYQNMQNPNFAAFMGFTKNADGTATLNFPLLDANDKVSFFSVDELGLPTLAILKDPAPYKDKRIVFSSPVFDQPLSAYQQTFERVTGVPAKLGDIKYEDVASFNKDFADVCLFVKEYGYFVGEADEIDATEIVDAPFSTFEQWLKQSTIPAQFRS